jgi:hypothetical protein
MSFSARNTIFTKTIAPEAQVFNNDQKQTINIFNNSVECVNETIFPPDSPNINYGRDNIKARSSGILPYAVHPVTKEIIFLFNLDLQGPNNHSLEVIGKGTKLHRRGFSDFGGKPDIKLQPRETALETALREFNEEIGCKSYLLETNTEKFSRLAGQGHRELNNLERNDLKFDIKKSVEFYKNKIGARGLPYIMDRNYCFFFMQIPYIPINLLPRHEDMHIHYNYRYPRKCIWISISQLTSIRQADFHMRIRCGFYGMIQQLWPHYRKPKMHLHDRSMYICGS